MGNRSKYDPLRAHLLGLDTPRTTMSIGEIEDVLGFELCESASTPWWWANTKNNAGRAQRHAWKDAGYDAFLATDGETVDFVRPDSTILHIRKKPGPYRRGLAR